MNEVIKEIRRASKAGYHFINLYQQCPRKWWIHYGLGLVPKQIGKALIYGKAWHEALEVIYTTNDETAALERGLAELDACTAEYRYAEDLAVDKAKMRAMIPLWSAWWRGMSKEYDVLEVEHEYSAELASGAKMTFRPDALLERKSDKTVYIAEHKSTSYSVDNMVHTVEAQDQATAYLWGLRKARPDLAPRICGVLLDIAYVRVYKGTVSDKGLVDGAIVNRTARDLAEFELSMSGLFNELGQKYLAWKSASAPPVPVLFPRNGTACSLFGCEYENICRMTLASGLAMGDDYDIDPLVAQDEVALRAVVGAAP